MNRPSRSIETHELVWHGIRSQVRFEREWLNSAIMAVAYLEFESVEPVRAPNPVSETGYRSQFILAALVDSLGRPVPFARNWLDQSAESVSWRERQRDDRQRELFDAD